MEFVIERLKRRRKTILIISDILSINLAYLFSFFVRFDLDIPNYYLYMYIKMLLFILILYLIPFIICKFYKSLWSNASIDEFLNGISGCLIGVILNLIYNNIINSDMPISVTLASSLLIFVFVVGIRLSYRIYRRIFIYGVMKTNEKSQRVLIIGGGYCAHIVIDEMFVNKNSNMITVGIIDDNKNRNITNRS